MKRLTSKDYQKKLNDLTDKANALDVNITSRLIELAKIYPDALPFKINENPLNDVKFMPVYSRLKYMEYIEKWAEEQHPHKQLKIDF